MKKEMCIGLDGTNIALNGKEMREKQRGFVRSAVTADNRTVSK